MVSPKDLLFASGIVSGSARVLNEATPAIVAAIALLTLGGISVSYGIGGGAMAAVSGLCIHALYDISTTASDPLPIINVGLIGLRDQKDAGKGDGGYCDQVT